MIYCTHYIWLQVRIEVVFTVVGPGQRASLSETASVMKGWDFRSFETYYRQQHTGQLGSASRPAVPVSVSSVAVCLRGPLPAPASPPPSAHGGGVYRKVGPRIGVLNHFLLGYWGGGVKFCFVLFSHGSEMAFYTLLGEFLSLYYISIIQYLENGGRRNRSSRTALAA